MRNLKEHLLQLGESVCDSGGGGGRGGPWAGGLKSIRRGWYSGL